MSTLFIDPELPKHPSRPAEEAVHALERWVAAGMRFALCLRSHPLLLMDVCLPGRVLHPQGSAGLRNTFPQFLATAAKTVILVKFIRDRLDLSRAEGTSLAA